MEARRRGNCASVDEQRRLGGPLQSPRFSFDATSGKISLYLVRCRRASTTSPNRYSHDLRFLHCKLQLR